MGAWLTRYPWLMVILPALAFAVTAANIVAIYRRGYVAGGPSGKVFRDDPDFRWRIGVFWLALLVWLAGLASGLAKLL